MPEWKRWAIKEAKDGGAAESKGWASKEHGFGYEYCIPQDKNTWAFSFYKKTRMH
jgi:hypothetical protein